jgi:hypothetical protein
VDDARLRFLFGTVPDADDYADEDGRIALLHADRPAEEADWPPSIRVVIANQVLDGEPSLVWATARRLLGLGLDRHAAMDQMVGAIGPQIAAALLGEEFDPAAYAAALQRLPVPAPAALRTAYLDAVRAQTAVSSGRLMELVAPLLGVEFAHPEWFEAVEDDLLFDQASPVTMAQPDTVVYVPALVDGAVLTHRLTAAEHAGGYLDLDADLGVFLRFPDPWVAQGPLVVVEDMAWGGPAGWLAELPLDALLAVRVTGDGAVTVTALAAEPATPPGLVDLLRSVYEAEVSEAGLPVAGEELVVGMLLRDRAAFAHPVPPLTELAAAAGLEQREDEFADDDAVWANAEAVSGYARVLERLFAPGQRSAALEAFGLLTGGGNPADLRRALDLLGDPEVLVAVLDGMLDEHDEHDEHDAERVAELVALGDRLVAAAGRAPRAAVARFVAATAAERDGRVLDAESHLRAASRVADGWWPVEDRLAACESDRGDAAAALRRWRSLDPAADDPDIDVVRPFAAPVGPEPGRNDPCWCGSGRKYKQCHRGQRQAPPLADRVGWLHRKAIGYVERRGGAASELLEEYADAFLSEDGELDATALDEPVVADAVLHEGGWFARFLADRGPLLPADERELGASWLTVERGVYEVVDASHVRDVRSGAQLVIAGRTGAVGTRICARALPDGTGARVLVAAVGVPRAREEVLLAVLAERDGRELLGVLGEPAPAPRTVLRSAPARPAPAAPSAAARQLQERREQRWCADPLPELGGRTPLEASADPARREALEGLIAALPADDAATGRLGLRPARIRELLGIT